METWLLTNVPTWVLGVAIVALAVALSLGGLVFVRRSVELSTLESHHEVAGFILAVVGVVYAVLLAFVVVVTWQQFEDARSATDTEAAEIAGLYRTSAGLPTGGARMRRALSAYTYSVADDEWPEMAEHHRESRRTDGALLRVWATLRALRPRGATQAPFYQEAVTRLVDASEMRRTRVLTSGTQLPVPVWVVLIVGAAISVAFTYFFGVRNFVAQALMVGALAAITGLVLFLILSLDLPFTGDVGVGPATMREVAKEFAHEGA
ncbi:MAG: DUF4239 domain-containing protein [Thermoleophilaceae bacterium]